MPLIHVLNGPNLNLLGQRQPEVYGHETLADLEALCRKAAAPHNIRFLQSNWEGQIVDWIHEARLEAAAIVINPAALTHTSVAVLDSGTVLRTYIASLPRVIQNGGPGRRPGGPTRTMLSASATSAVSRRRPTEVVRLVWAR